LTNLSAKKGKAGIPCAIAKKKEKKRRTERSISSRDGGEEEDRIDLSNVNLQKKGEGGGKKCDFFKVSGAHEWGKRT